MQNDNIRASLDRFAQVWPRVQGQGGPPPRPESFGPPPPPGPPMGPGERREAGRLAELIAAEASAERRYRRMAALSRGSAATKLRQLAAGCARLRRRLASEYLLLTGDEPAPPPQPREIRGVDLRTLYRDAYRAAEERRTDFLRAASETRSDSLRLLYGDAAQQCLREQQTLRGLARGRSAE